MRIGRGQMAEYFKQLFKVNPPSRWLQTTGLQVMDAVQPINKAVPSVDEVKEAVAKLRGRKAAGICNISGVAQSWRRGHGPWIACCLDCCMAFRYHSS